MNLEEAKAKLALYDEIFSVLIRFKIIYPQVLDLARKFARENIERRDGNAKIQQKQP